MDTDPRSWPGQLLGAAVVILVAVFLIRWAWALARPLVPILLTVTAVVTAFVMVLSYRRNRW